MKSIFGYYGGRYYQLPEILSIMESHLSSFDSIVDVFGGSGKVLLNIPDEWKKIEVYNDINKDLYYTFKVLQDRKKRSELTRKLRNSFAHYEIFKELQLSNPKRDVDIAFKTLYLHTHSFASAGRLFRRQYAKANIKKVNTENFLLVYDWNIDNLDFRALLKRYNKPKVLLYLDPPYLRGGDLYRYKFKMEDFVELKELLDEHKGPYILNLSMTDPEMVEIFGKLQMITEHSRPISNGEKRDSWRWGYWWKI